jgi:uncharacterized Zn finger protein
MAFQNLNIVPQRVTAQVSTTQILHIRIDITGLSDERLTLIAAKLGQLSMVTHAFWHH